MAGLREMGADNSKGSAGCFNFGAGSARPETHTFSSRIALSSDEACATALDSKRISHRAGFHQATPEEMSSSAAVSASDATKAVLDSRRMSHRAEFRAAEPNPDPSELYSA